MTMRTLDGEMILTRIFVGDSDRVGGRALHHVLLERLRKEGFAGATVLHGVSGFGANSVIHTAHILDLSTDLPVVIEVIDDQTHTDKLIAILDELLEGGMVTMEKVRVLRYAPRKKKERE
jgi:PII-like signaling protein